MRKLLTCALVAALLPFASMAQEKQSVLMGLGMSPELAAKVGRENAPNVNIGATGAVVPVLFGTFYKLENSAGTTTGWLSAGTGNITLRTTESATLVFATNALTRWTMGTDGSWTQNGTNGGSIVLSKASTSVAQTSAAGLTAAGTVIGDALQLTAVYNNVDTVGANSGVKLWNPSVGTQIWVRNGGANDLKLYPADASGNINGIGAGTAKTLTTAAKQIAQCTYVATNVWDCVIASGN